MAANGNLPYDSGNLNWVYITRERGGMGREGGRTLKWKGTWVNLWPIQVDVW